MKPAIVNTEYERVLYQDITGKPGEAYIQKARSSRQYLYYFINQSPGQKLISTIDLSRENADYLQKCGVILPELLTNAEGENWYGLMTEIELERQLNSKLHTYELLKRFGDLPPDAHIVASVNDIRRIVGTNIHKGWILKPPYNCGGAGFISINQDADIPDEIKFPHILEPFHHRVLDMSLYYDPKLDVSFSYVSHIHRNGTYLGGRIFHSRELLDAELKSTGHLDIFYEANEKLKKYLEILKSFPLKQPLTLDTFCYQENHQLKAYPLCEVNYRLSMGTLNHALKRFIPEDGVGMIMAIKPNMGVDWKNVIPYNPDSKVGILSMNEENPHSSILLLSAPNTKILNGFQHMVFSFEKK